MSRADDIKFSPTNGTPWGTKLLPMHPDTFRKRNPKRTWLFNPWTGVLRDTKDVVDNPFMEQVAPPFPPIANPVEARRPVGVHPAMAAPYGRGMTLDECCAAEGGIQFAGAKPIETDPTGRGAHAPGAKMDAGKPRVWLCVSGFSNALAAVADVTTKGAEKYAPNSWMSVPDGTERYMDGFARHALALGRGETHDTGSGGTGCLHKAQMIWNLLASLELEIRNDAGWSRGS